MRLFDDLEYENSKSLLEQALKLDPSNQAAQQKLQVVTSLLGIHADKLAIKIRELEESERVKQQESLIQLANALDEAKVLENKIGANSYEMRDDVRERIFVDRLENLRRAQDKFRRVKEILNWMPPTMDLPDERAATEAGLARVKQSIANAEDEINYLRRVQASRETEAARVRETELFQKRMTKLLGQVRDLYADGNYQAAERLSIRILQIDPFNAEAEEWKMKARASLHDGARVDGISEGKKAGEDIDEATIGYAPIILYPSNWDPDYTARRCVGQCEEFYVYGN